MSLEPYIRFKTYKLIKGFTHSGKFKMVPHGDYVFKTFEADRNGFIEIASLYEGHVDMDNVYVVRVNDLPKSALRKLSYSFD